MSRTPGTVLVLHDTTEFSYKRDDIKVVGITDEVSSRRKPDRRLPKHTVCGVLMHSSLAVTTEGLPLGIAAVKFWTSLFCRHRIRSACENGCTKGAAPNGKKPRATTLLSLAERTGKVPNIRTKEQQSGH